MLLPLVPLQRQRAFRFPITLTAAGLSDEILRRDRKIKWGLLITFLVFAAAIGRLTFMLWPFDSDGAMFAYMGKIVSEGGRFNHDLCDNKFPTTALITGFFYRICGTNWNGYVLCETTLITAGIFLLGRSARRWAGQWAWTPTVLYAAVYLNFFPVVFGGFQLEAIQSFLSIVCAVYAIDALMTDRPAPIFIAGIAAGMAAMCKPTGLAAVGAYGLIATWKYGRRREFTVWMRQMLALTTGLAVPAAGVMWYLLAADNLRDIPAIYDQIKRYAADSRWGILDVLKLPMALGFVFYPTIVRGPIFRRDRLPDPDVTSRNRRLVWTYALAWFIVEFIGVVAQRRMYAYHYLVIGPAAALIFGTLPRRSRPVTMFASLLPIAMLSIQGAAAVTQVQGVPQRQLELSLYLKQHTHPGQMVWMDDEPRLLLEAQLTSASRYPITFTFANYDAAPLEYSAGLVADLERNRPVYVMLPRDFEKEMATRTRAIWELRQVPLRRENFLIAWNRIRAFVEANYRVETHIKDQTVWRLR